MLTSLRYDWSPPEVTVREEGGFRIVSWLSPLDGSPWTVYLPLGSALSAPQVRKGAEPMETEA